MNRSTSARLAGLAASANCTDLSARASGGQDGLRDRFIREARERLGEDATDAAVATSAELARRAYFVRLAEKRWGPKRARTA